MKFLGEIIFDYREDTRINEIYDFLYGRTAAA